MTPCVRNAFIITSADGTSDGEVLRYDQSFALRTTAGFDGEESMSYLSIVPYLILNLMLKRKETVGLRPGRGRLHL
ncbi:hypothetical protein cypCar_00036426 [Cyprinus carpio]|nr:hypothetical protein cypCar_00036426 [Cyprinus carpio]